MANKIYFGKKVEDAIIEYNALTDQEQKNRLFEKSIYKPFKEIAKRVIQRWKVYYVEDGYDEELVLHMWENIGKYNPTKLNKAGQVSKAFSYFSYIARNQAWKDNNIAYDKVKTDDEPVLADSMDETYHKYVLNDYEQEMEMEDNFTQGFIEFMKSRLDTLFPNKVDNATANAIIDVISRRDKLDLFDKKTLSIYTKEMTTVSDSKYVEVFKVFQREFRKLYDDYLEDGELF